MSAGQTLFETPHIQWKMSLLRIQFHDMLARIDPTAFCIKGRSALVSHGARQPDVGVSSGRHAMLGIQKQHSRSAGSPCTTGYIQLVEFILFDHAEPQDCRTIFYDARALEVLSCSVSKA